MSKSSTAVLASAYVPVCGPRVLLCLLTLAGFICLPAGAQTGNLVTNPGFESDLSGWTGGGNNGNNGNNTGAEGEGEGEPHWPWNTEDKTNFSDDAKDLLKKVILTGGAGYLLYRGVRMVPSLAIPLLWPTAPANLAVP